jgi:hypothetical protein
MGSCRPTLALGSLLLLACGCSPGAVSSWDGGSDRSDTKPPLGDAGSSEGGPSRAIGTIRDVTYSGACAPSYGTPVGQELGDGGGANPDFRCVTLTVGCPGIADMTVVVALAGEPPGVTPKGVVVTHDRDDGTTFFEGALPEAWFANGFALAEVAWATPWECPRGSAASSPTKCIRDTTPLDVRPGLLDVACRPATVFAWIHDAATSKSGGPFVPHGEAFCGFGVSAGSGALWYSLLHYGLDAAFDYVGVAASTPYGRIDIGCNPERAHSTIATPCENLPEDPLVPEQYDSNHSPHANLIDDWSSTQSCDVAPSREDLAYWRRNSIVSTGASYDIATPVTSYDCIDPSNVDIEPGMNAYLFAELAKVDPKATRFQPLCVLDGSGGAACSGEAALGDAGMLQQTAVLDMEKKCVPIER